MGKYTLSLSRPMLYRLLRVQEFLNASEMQSDEMLALYAIAATDDYFNGKVVGVTFFGYWGGTTAVPLNLDSVTKDARGKPFVQVTLNLETASQEFTEALEELRCKAKQKDLHDTLLLSIGYLSELVLLIQEGKMILVGKKGEDEPLDEYTPHVLELYKPALFH